MLEKLLAEIRSGGTFETGALAAKLGTTPALVEAMLNHLQRSGHIHPYDACNNSCGGCSLKKECKAAPPANAVRLWQG
jgi:Mn-dependent DtxR family transcriptional regulator